MCFKNLRYMGISTKLPLHSNYLVNANLLFIYIKKA